MSLILQYALKKKNNNPSEVTGITFSKGNSFCF